KTFFVLLELLPSTYPNNCPVSCVKCSSSIHFTKFVFLSGLYLGDLLLITSPILMLSQSSGSTISPASLSVLNLSSCEKIFCIIPFLYCSNSSFFFLSCVSFSSTLERKEAILVCSGREGKVSSVVLMSLRAKPGIILPLAKP